MRFNDQDKIDICKQYIKGFSSGFLAKKYKTSRTVICSFLRVRKIEIRNASECQPKYKIKKKKLDKRRR